jgi:hypothetical protein
MIPFDILTENLKAKEQNLLSQVQKRAVSCEFKGEPNDD